MLKDHLMKQPTKEEANKKAEAWKTLNAVLVRTNAEFTQKLSNMLTENQEKHDLLKAKIEKGEAEEKDNAEYLFIGGYVQCLKDILGHKKEA